MMLTPKQAAEWAKVSPSLVYQWIKERRLACYRMGATGKRGRILIDPGDLDKLIHECRQERHPLLNV
jgi:excisionase family DNA binding protein